MYLTEVHKISKGQSYFGMLDDFCLKAKNLYNSGLYLVRQYYMYCMRYKMRDGEELNISPEVISYMENKGMYIDYYKMDYLAKQLDNSLAKHYKAMPIAVSAQGVLRQLDHNWKLYFKKLKNCSNNPDKHTKVPSMPKYLDKNGRYMLVLTSQSCKIKDGKLVFPKAFCGLEFKTKADNVNQVRIIPKYNSYHVELIYNIPVEEKKQDNGRYFSVDIGVNNLAAITNNFNGQQWLISGKPIKSQNQYYNKLRNEYIDKAKRLNGKYFTNRLAKLTKNRNNRINTYLHKASKIIVDLAVEYNVSKIVVGYRKDWQGEAKICQMDSENFISIPFFTFINYIKYKAECKGIEIVTIEEAYTSGTSFLDAEMPERAYYNNKRRMHRGLFKSNNGHLLNADINGSYQILKKVIGNYIAEPQKINVLKVT